MDIHYVINLLDFKEFEAIEKTAREDGFICYKIIVNKDEYIEYARHYEQPCYHIARFLNNDLDIDLNLIIDSSHEMYEKAITGEKMIKSYLGE